MNEKSKRTRALNQILEEDAERESLMERIGDNQREEKATMIKIGDPPFLAIHTSWREDIAAYPEQAVAALLLAFYCREKMNHSVVEDASELLSNNIKRGLLGLGKEQSEMILRGNSPFWHWDGNSLIVDMYSVHYEDKMRKKSAQAKEAVRIREEKRKNRGKRTADHRTMNKR